MPGIEALVSFRNEPLTDFSIPANRHAIQEALARVKSQFGQAYPLIIDGRRVKAKKTFSSINPSHFFEIVGIVSNADRRLADRALAAASRAYESWSRTPVSVRSEALRRMADQVRRRKFEFCAWMVFEVGKSWAEADADVAEAIDFLEYYARLALVPPPVLTPVFSEKNVYVYRPLGPVVVIPPWNFPLAILVGMTSAAVVAGNTVVLKPSSQSPVIAAKFMEVVETAGVPPGVINFLTGSGSAIGDYLVSDPRTRMIAFTGSRTVGLHVNELAAHTGKRQRWIKRVIAEMGGKNAIVVDESADVESAAAGVLASAFGYQGQKCSACSRAYIHQEIYEHFVERLLDKVKAIKQGPAEDPMNFMGPVISASAMKTILKYIAVGKREGKLLSSSFTPPGEGYFIPPTVFDRLPASSRLWREEIFGPVLALKPVKTFQDGLREANATEYGLTGAVFSRDPSHLTLAREEMLCGNLYLNRKCTGAWVGGHPFGGFHMSGTDSKAGGPDYLLLFQQAQCVSEKG